jgi:streptogramin lyase
VYAYQHASGTPTGCAITGGAFYNPPTPASPAAYLGKYFFAEFCSGWIYYLDPGGPATASQFAASISSPVDLKIGPDGSLYYLARGTGSVGRIMPTGTVLTAPKNLRIVQ